MFFLVLGVLVVLPHIMLCYFKEAQSYWTLKPHELVVDEDINNYDSNMLVPLVCGEAFEGQNVVWRKDSGEKLQVQGNRILALVEERIGGTYTCYSKEGNYLNHTLVLVQWPYRKILKGTNKNGYIHCSANNYSGFFQCSWSWDKTRTGKVALIKITRSHSVGNISCSLDTSGDSITCQNHAYCAYAEELDCITLTIYFRSNYVIESYYLQFQISDIVRPDKVNIRKKNNTLELQYPESWNTPSSYFPLSFQVKEIRCRKKHCDCSNHRSSKVNLTQNKQWPIKKGVTVCVRAQDYLCNSSWGKWNQYKCTKERNNNISRVHKAAKDTHDQSHCYRSWCRLAQCNPLKNRWCHNMEL